MVATDILPWYEAEAKERMLTGKPNPSPGMDKGRATSQVGKLLGTNRESIRHAKKNKRG